jgi:hypothetical protein
VKKLSELWGRNRKAAPAGESPVLAAHGDFPAGVRTAILEVGGVQWEVIYHQPEKSFSLRHLGDADAGRGPAFILEEDHIADIVVQKGTLLHPKTLKMLKDGAWLDTLHPGTYFSALDLESPKNDDGTPSSYYILRYGELIAYLTQSVAPIVETTHALEGGTANGSSDGGRSGAQPAGGEAGAGGAGEPPASPGAGGGIDQP